MKVLVVDGVQGRAIQQHLPPLRLVEVLQQVHHRALRFERTPYSILCLVTAHEQLAWSHVAAAVEAALSSETPGAANRRHRSCWYTPQILLVANISLHATLQA